MKTYRFILLILLHLTCALSADTWKIFWYMDSTDDLNDMAIKNLTDIMRGKPNDHVDLVIQLHAYFDAGLRYRVTENGTLTFVQEVALSGDSKQDFIDAAQWAFADNCADHVMLIIANHGWGVLDPQWNPMSQEWEADAGGLADQCPLKKNHIHLVEEHKNHRGFMFSKTAQSYLNNHDLTEGLAYIANTILTKKIDILAFDTCMGDMFEIAYLAAPYADYLVGNQSCALLDGFDYQGVMATFNQGPTVRAACAGMVHAFDVYYGQHDASGIYTHAALDLSHIDATNKAVDGVVDQLLTMPELIAHLRSARDESPRFCLWPMYTDLVAFGKCIEDEITTLELSPALLTLHNALHDMYDAVAAMVVARCGGVTTQGRAYGVAIYLPPAAIDHSYYQTSFARETRWIKLLEMVSGD